MCRKLLVLWLLGGIGLLWLGACSQREKTAQGAEKVPPPSDSALCYQYYHAFKPDSAALFLQTYRASLPKHDLNRQAEAIILEIRLLRLNGKPRQATQLTDSLRAATASLPLLPKNRAALWNETGENLLTTDKDSALWAAQQAHIYLDSLTSDKNDFLIRNKRILERVAIAKQEYETAYGYLQENARLCQEAHNPYLTYLCHNDLGYYYYLQENSYEAQKAYEKAYQILKTNFPHKRQIRADLGLYISDLYRYFGRLELAKNVLEDAASWFEEKNKLEALSNCYRKIGLIYYDKGENDLAIEYLNKALFVLPDKADPYIYNDIALAYKEKKEFGQAIHNLKRCIPIYQADQNRTDEAIAFFNLGVCYELSQKYDSAINCLRQIPNLETEISGKWIQFQALTIWGNVLTKQGKSNEAEAKLHQALALAQSQNEQNSWQQAEIFMGLAEAKKAQQALDEALKYNQLALCQLFYNFEDSNFRNNPPLKDIAHPKHLLTALRQKSVLLRQRFGQQKQTADLEFCLQTQELAQDLIDSIRLDFSGNNAKLALMGELLPLYEQSIATALELQQLKGDKRFAEKAFLYAERNKATVLYESLQSQKALQSAGLPDSLLQKLQDLQSEIGYIEREMYTLQGQGQDSLRAVVLDLREELLKLSSRIQKDYPTYNQQKEQFAIPAIGEIQAKLTENQSAMLAYFVGDSAAYVFGLDGKNVQLAQIQVDSLLEFHFGRLRAELSQRHFIHQPEKAYQHFTESAFFLYERLLSPLAAALKAHKHLLVIPDGFLGYLPFEVLLESKAQAGSMDYGELPYLLHKHEFSYAYSATLWHQPFEPSGGSLENCIAFAPLFEGTSTQDSRDSQRQQLSTLAETQGEAEAVARKTGGKAYIREAASETRFKQEAAHYRIIHLATHALIHDENPLDLKLAFAEEKDRQNDGFLYVYELFGMRLNAQMAVLSACNTGNGKLLRGEGVMSLARGFAQAGVPAVVMSLWTAQDQSTSQIMETFYDQLSQGKNKAESLQAAKLHYLSNAQRMATHPYFWGAFVMLGNNEALSFEQGRGWLWYVAGGMGLLLAAIGIWWQKRDTIRTLK